jgi:hypothetical protein
MYFFYWIVFNFFWNNIISFFENDEEFQFDFTTTDKNSGCNNRVGIFLNLYT